MQTTKHEFALFWQGKKSLTECSKNTTCTIDDPALFHRITTVLRAKKDDEFVLFDREIHCNVKIITIEKKSIQVRILHTTQNTIILPSVTFLLPLLKRDTLHETVYALTEVGCSTIQLIITKKVHGSWQEREFEKLQKILIAAAEQSKNFNFPEIISPITLEMALKKSQQQESTKIFFDPTGISCEMYFKNTHSTINNNAAYFLLIGPEGDLTKEEKEQVYASQFSSVKLTQTILRAQQAATLGAGIIRSFI